MKKHLFLLSMVAGLTMTACDLFTKMPSNFLKEFQGYELATSVKDGEKYLFGVYRSQRNYDVINFASGDYHRDSKGYYPFYMGVNAGGTVEGAAEIEIGMINSKEFTMKVVAPGKVWDGKYIGVYAAVSSYDNKVMSIALLDSPTQKSYEDPKSQKTYTSLCGTFQFFKKYDGKVAYAPAAVYAYPDLDPEPVPKFFGTDYVSQESLDKGEAEHNAIDCKSFEAALDYENYDLAHLYHKK